MKDSIYHIGMTRVTYQYHNIDFLGFIKIVKKHRIGLLILKTGKRINYCRFNRFFYLPWVWLKANFK